MTRLAESISRFVRSSVKIILTLGGLMGVVITALTFYGRIQRSPEASIIITRYSMHTTHQITKWNIALGAVLRIHNPDERALTIDRLHVRFITMPPYRTFRELGNFDLIYIRDVSDWKPFASQNVLTRGLLELYVLWDLTSVLYSEERVHTATRIRAIWYGKTEHHFDARLVSGLEILGVDSEKRVLTSRNFFSRPYAAAIQSVRDPAFHEPMSGEPWSFGVFQIMLGGKTDLNSYDVYLPEILRLRQ